MGRRNNMKVKKTCPSCGREFFVKPSVAKKGWGRYCSRKCLNVAHNWKGGKIKRICETCGKEFEVWHSTVKNKNRGKFCSQQCAYIRYIGKNNPSWKGGKVKRVCQCCGKEFFIHPSWVKKGEGILCSKKCQGIWAVKHMRKKDTSIELAIEDELKKQNIPYLKQCPIEGIALVDFLLPNKIIIQCDGDYWHSFQKAKDKDANQDLLLNFKGYKVYRFTGTEIRESTKKCILKIIGKKN